jgi:hypothetical protein
MITLSTKVSGEPGPADRHRDRAAHGGVRSPPLFQWVWKVMEHPRSRGRRVVGDVLDCRRGSRLFAMAANRVWARQRCAGFSGVCAGFPGGTALLPGSLVFWSAA